MGCSVSRIDANGMSFSTRLRKVFLPRLDKIAIRRHRQHFYDSTLSRKNLLSHESDSLKDSKMTLSSGEDSTRVGLNDKEIKEMHVKNPKEEVSHNENSIAACTGYQSESNMAIEDILREEDKIVKPEYEEGDMDDVFMDVESGPDEDNIDDDEDNNEGGRMISHIYDEPYIGSPSFRIYYKDNGEDELEKTGENHVVKDVGVDVVVSSKESYVEEKVEKRKSKRKSFKKVLAKGFSVKSCYTPSNTSHDRKLLLTV